MRAVVMTATGGREVLEQHPRWTIDPAAPWPFEEATVFQLKAPAYQSLVAVVG